MDRREFLVSSTALGVGSLSGCVDSLSGRKEQRSTREALIGVYGGIEWLHEIEYEKDDSWNLSIMVETDTGADVVLANVRFGGAQVVEVGTGAVLWESTATQLHANTGEAFEFYVGEEIDERIVKRELQSGESIWESGEFADPSAVTYMDEYIVADQLRVGLNRETGEVVFRQEDLPSVVQESELLYASRDGIVVTYKTQRNGSAENEAVVAGFDIDSMDVLWSHSAKLEDGFEWGDVFPVERDSAGGEVAVVERAGVVDAGKTYLFGIREETGERVWQRSQPPDDKGMREVIRKRFSESVLIQAGGNDVQPAVYRVSRESGEVVDQVLARLEGVAPLFVGQSVIWNAWRESREFVQLYDLESEEESLFVSPSEEFYSGANFSRSFLVIGDMGSSLIVWVNEGIQEETGVKPLRGVLARVPKVELSSN